MSDEKHIEQWKELKGAIVPENVVSYALVAITDQGAFHWGADFGLQPEMVLRGLNLIRYDLERYIKSESAKRREAQP